MVFKQEEKLPGNSFYAPLRKVMQVNAGLDHLFLLYHVIIFWSLISKARGENELGNLIVFTEIGKPLFIDVTSSWSFLFFFLVCVCEREWVLYCVWSLIAKHRKFIYVVCCWNLVISHSFCPEMKNWVWDAS